MMKKFYNITKVLILISVLTACKKAEMARTNGGAINVVNAVVGGATILLVTEKGVTNGNNTVNVNGAAIMPLLNSESRLVLISPPVAASSTVPAVPAITYYNQPITITNKINYSLFLTGPSPSAVESVLIKETYPYAYQDSVCGVRFINLAQGNIPVMVNIKGSANGSEAASVAYKAYTDFKQYPAKRANPNYIFEFRKLDGTLITSYTLITPYFHNVTLALRGTIGGSTGVILNNDY